MSVFFPVRSRISGPSSKGEFRGSTSVRKRGRPSSGGSAQSFAGFPPRGKSTGPAGRLASEWRPRCGSWSTALDLSCENLPALPCTVYLTLRSRSAFVIREEFFPGPSFGGLCSGPHTLAGHDGTVLGKLNADRTRRPVKSNSVGERGALASMREVLTKSKVNYAFFIK